jgi:hypothetical protein
MMYASPAVEPYGYSDLSSHPLTYDKVSTSKNRLAFWDYRFGRATLWIGMKRKSEWLRFWVPKKGTKFPAYPGKR